MIHYQILHSSLGLNGNIVVEHLDHSGSVLLGFFLDPTTILKLCLNLSTPFDVLGLDRRHGSNLHNI